MIDCPAGAPEHGSEWRRRKTDGESRLSKAPAKRGLYEVGAFTKIGKGQASATGLNASPVRQAKILKQSKTRLIENLATPRAAAAKGMLL